MTATPALAPATRCRNWTTKVCASVVIATDVIVPEGMFVLELQNTGVRKLAKLNGTTNRYGQRNLDTYAIETVVIDGAIWGTLGARSGWTSVMEG